MNDPMIRYGLFRPCMKSGDCLLWRSKSIIGWMIRLFTGHNVNHAGLVVVPYKIGTLSHRRFTLEALEPGIVLRLLSERLRGYEGKMWLYPLKEELDEYREVIISKALADEGVKYDYASLIKQAIGRVSVNADRYFCSEFCYSAYKKAGVPMPDLESAPRPGDLPSLGIFDTPVLLYG